MVVLWRKRLVQMLATGFVFSMLLVPAGAMASSSESRWVFENIDSDKVDFVFTFGQNNDGDLEALYVGNGSLKQASQTGASWSVETVFGLSTSYQDTTLVYDSNGQPCIFIGSSYYSDGFMYLTRKDGTWKMHHINESTSDLRNIVMAFDSKNNMHITCVSTRTVWNGSSGSTVGSVVHLTDQGGNWTREVIENETRWPSGLAMVIDAKDKIHALYVSSPVWAFPSGSPNSTLRYATNAKGEWNVSDVDDLGEPNYPYYYGQKMQLVLDADGHDHICYARMAADTYRYGHNVTLIYANNRDGSWKNSTIDSSQKVSLFASLALDKDGLPHVAYNDWYNDDPMYASYDGSAWRIERLQSVGVSGYASALSLDSGDRPHILWLNLTDSDYYEQSGVLVHATLRESSDGAAYAVIAVSLVAVVATALIIWRVRW